MVAIATPAEHSAYWATVKSGDHWYMVSVSDILQPYHKQWWVERIS